MCCNPRREDLLRPYNMGAVSAFSLSRQRLFQAFSQADTRFPHIYIRVIFLPLDDFAHDFWLKRQASEKHHLEKYFVLSPKMQLIQVVSTGFIRNTYYLRKEEIFNYSHAVHKKVAGRHNVPFRGSQSVQADLPYKRSDHLGLGCKKRIKNQGSMAG